MVKDSYYKCVELSQRIDNFTINKIYMSPILNMLIDDKGQHVYIYPEEFKCFELVVNSKNIHNIKIGQEYDYIRPQHYKLWNDNNDGLIVLKSVLTHEQYKGFLIGNILKYQLRLGKKPNEPVEKDMAKIKFLQEEIIKLSN